MKKVGVLTFHRAVNYGAVLQAYALVQTLKKIGMDAEIIDYRNEKIEESYYKISGFSNNLKSIIRNIILFPTQRKRNNAFKKCIEEHFAVSNVKYTKNNIYDANEVYDLIITGSDQVWNLPCTGGDKTFFLDFVKDDEKKYSYAASFGKIKNEEAKYDEYFKLIEKLKCVSVREESGKEFLIKNINKDIRMDIDPVFLLKQDEWKKFAKKTDLKNYVLLYSVNLPNEFIEYARRITKQLGKKLVIITLRNRKLKLLKNEINCSCCMPDEFVGLINCADMVITNSFHGTAFSIILHKKFVVVRNSENKMGMDNSRLDNILNLLKLSDRISENVDIYENINYICVDEATNRLKQNSLKYLNMLKE